MATRFLTAICLILCVVLPVSLSADDSAKVIAERAELLEFLGVDKQTAARQATYRAGLQYWTATLAESKEFPAIQEKALALFGSSDPYLREFALWTASRAKDKRAVAPLRHMLLWDEDEKLRAGAAIKLAEMEVKEALPDLKNLLERGGESDGVLSAAFGAAADLSAPWLVPVGKKLIGENPAAELLNSIAHDLTKNQSPEVARILGELMRKESLGDERQQVADILSDLAEPGHGAQGQAAIEEFGKTLSTGKVDDRFWQLFWFENVQMKGPAAQKLIPILKKILQESVPENKERGMGALHDAGGAAQILFNLGVPPEEIAPRLAEFADRVSKGYGGSHANEMDQFENFYHALPDDLQKAFDRERRKRLRERTAEKVKANPPCQVLCELVRRAPDWSEERFYISPEGAKGQRLGWEFAMRSLGVLFMAKAAPYCPEAKKRFLEIQNKWLTAPEVKPSELPKEDATIFDVAPVGEQEEKKKEDEAAAYLNAALAEIKVGLDAEAVARLEAFAKNAAVRTSNGPPRDAPTVYGKLFYALFLREMQRNTALSSQDQKRVAQAIQADEQSLNGDLGKFERAQRGVDGSLFNTYLLSSTILALPIPADGALKKLDHLIATAPSPATLPYDIESERGNDRSGAARSVVAQLAGYLKAPDAQKKEAQQRKLEFVLNNYLNHVPSLQDHVSYNAVHTGFDGLAPYYYYPSIPYAAAALRKLEHDATDPKLKTQRQEDLQELYGGLLEMLEKDRVFRSLGQNNTANKSEGLAEEEQPQGKRTYDSSPAYVNPLAGLAIVAMVDSCDGKKVRSSFGIMDSASEQAVPRSQDEKVQDNATHPDSDP